MTDDIPGVSTIDDRTPSYPLIAASDPVHDPTLHPDNQLMARVAEGDLDALGDLYDRYHRRLFSFFFRTTGRRDVSEDLVQDVFLRIMRYRVTFRHDAPFTVWMYQLARTATADRFKKWRRERPIEDGMSDRVASDERVHDMVAETEEQALLHDALARLSPEKREVLVLSRFEDLTYEQIGRIVNAPVGTIKARVHYALKDLRREFEALATNGPAATSRRRGIR